MPTDPGDVDFHTPEQKQLHHEEWLKSEQGKRFQKESDREKRKELIATALKWLFGIGLLAFVAWWLLPADWRIKYASEYMLDPEQVTIEHKPHDCDWDSAPLGNKHCHYEEFVTVYNQDGKIIETSFGKADPEPLDQTPAKARVEWRRIVE
jgi:hypothetical protein